jgi:hypothetical protein
LEQPPGQAIDKASLLARVADLSVRSERVACNQFQGWFAALPKTEQFSLIEWNRLVDFVADQRAQWSVAWLFSHGNEPNAAAEAEADGWTSLWTRYSAALIERAPAVREATLRYRDLSAIQYAVQRRLEFNRGRPFQRVVVPILGWLGIQLNRLGLRRLGAFVYRFSLYPPGTIGRDQG